MEPLPDNVTVIEAKKTSDHVEVSCIFSDFTVNNTLPFHHKLVSLNILLMLKLTEFDLIIFFQFGKVKLPTEVFASRYEEEEGMLNLAAPVSGD